MTRPRRVAAAAALMIALAAAATAALLLDRAPRPPLAGPPDRPPGLTDLWEGRAALVLDRQWSSTSLDRPQGGAYSGAHIEVTEDRWYLFHRRTEDRPCDGHGPQSQQMGTEVRESRDRGLTWSPPRTVIAPTPGTPWACAATDGDAFYDEEHDLWGFLFQCQGAAPGWHGCYAERRGRNPLGAFEGRPDPVIAPTQLWGPICDDPGDSCHRPAGRTQVHDEGTFNVFARDRGGWWVGFHGYDGADAFRGIARTRDFRRWQVDGQGGTPRDAVLEASDATKWREQWAGGGPVGAGAAHVLEQDGWLYQLAEFPDTSLACTMGQNWDLGLFRARDPASTRWEQIPAGNPVVYSSKETDASGQVIFCNAPYPSLFEDPAIGATYLMHGRISSDPESDGIYVYRLEWDRNLLVNGSFARADADGWDLRPGAPAQVSVERLPARSPDGTPYLALACGPAGCAGGPSVYQDVGVEPGLARERLAFGGTVSAAAGEIGLGIVVHQLDANGAAIDSATVDVVARSRHVRARGELVVHDDARRLRFELYPRAPGNLRADNLYLIPQNGCARARYPAC